MCEEKQYYLEMRNITKTFPGVKALDDVTLKIKAGTVHALMGENGAGKSTLMKCLFGLYSQDSGDIYLDGKAVVLETPKKALDHGISMIHQELNPIPQRNVMDNIWLGRYPMVHFGPFSFVDEKKMYRDTKALIDDLSMDIDPKMKVVNMSVSKVQSMEITKAVSYNSKIIIMDEPTSSLTEREVAHLFKIIRDLKSRGVVIIYISHKIEEILQIADEVTIMRDGKAVGTWPSGELTNELIINRMVGRELTHRFPEKTNIPSDVILKVEGLTSPFPKSFKNVSFELRRGEILGVGGLVGAQRTELAEAIFGLRTVESGKVTLKGKEVTIHSPIDAKQEGIALFTEDRRGTVIIPVLSVMDNTIVANLDRYSNWAGFVNEKICMEAVKTSIQQLRIKTPSTKSRIANLSGGNQQKVLLARWLLTEPDILILDEPTRGIDVGAKFEIYTIILELAMRGKAIIMISSEMPELLGVSDRIMVMCEGRMTGILNREEASQEKIMQLATQFM